MTTKTNPRRGCPQTSRDFSSVSALGKHFISLSAKSSPWSGSYYCSRFMEVETGTQRINEEPRTCGVYGLLPRQPIPCHHDNQKKLCIGAYYRLKVQHSCWS